MNVRKKSGFTLVELMVVAVLSSMVAGAAMNIWSYARRNISKTTTRQILQMDAQRILTQFKADMKAAKADTFKSTDNPMTLEFKRYVVSQEDNTKLSADKVEDVKYAFTKPILRRQVTGSFQKTLSTNVENIRIRRKELTDAQRETDAYLEARVDISLDLAAMAPGTGSEEKFSQHTSAVIRDEFYTLANKEREEVLTKAAEVAEEIDKNTDSSFFNEELNAASLSNLTEKQLANLQKTQEDAVEDAKASLKELDDRIDSVDTGKKWWQVAWWSNDEGADVKKMREDLAKIKCPDTGTLPAKEDKTRPSDKVDGVLERINGKIVTLEAKFFGKSYEGTPILDADSADSETKRLAALQKKAYDMKLTDRQIDKAMEKMTEDEKVEAKANNVNKMIDTFNRTPEEIREEFRISAVVPEGSDEFEVMVQRELKDQKFIRDQYAACKLDWMDSSSEDANAIKAYEGAKQLKSLAESKKETLRIKEMALDNMAEIEEAKRIKNESLTGN
ncbi:MAG: type II secretion system GspH family protein [Candidatus Riflebacteria bacterium]|nr:type II secretion system GspH family protein [Candidatus Riflebacteria bacterium]